MKAVAERNSSIVLVQIDPDPTGETPFDTTRGVIVDTRRRTVSEPAYVQSILQRGYWVPFQGDQDEVVGIVASITAAGFDESEHPRHPKGSEKGGEFAPKDGTSEPLSEDRLPPHTRPSWLGKPATNAVEAHDKALHPREDVARARGWLTENGITEVNGIPVDLLNAVGVVEGMQEHFPDGYEAFLAIELDDHKEAFHHNFARNGEYTSGRLQDFHEPTRAMFVREGHPPPAGEKPTAIFMAGGTASGKTSIVGTPKLDGTGEFKNGLIDVGSGNVSVNPDAIKPLSDEAHDLMMSGDERWAMLSHEESSQIANRIRKDAEKAGFPMVVDGTGDAQGPSPKYPEGKFMDKVRAAERAGYRTKIVMVDIPTDEAVKRARKRAEDEAKAHGGAGRKVSEAAIRSLHRNVTQRHLEWRELASDWEVWANDDPDQGGRRLIARRVNGGKIEILEPERYKQLEAKANE